ncbi:MAG: acetyl-CoA carboxylase biotin carboxylase subunit [Coriobacteriales bacterium]|jgi:acetyl-CoA carboxylase biotin carboxylase subunit|nr:acetyl-CoA carboxylase biotin carboxylase subunit [Coriobacteriales bacterium]
MLKKILVANRGEIAARILRACREMNIATVAVYSEADRGALFTTLATEAYCIGAAPAKQSYLNSDAILTVAAHTGCDGLHPGFGFLSEDAAFVREVEAMGISFIGPKAQTIADMGDKDKARSLMRKSGVSTVPGSDGVLQSVDDAQKCAEQIGYPVLLKARSGGGGRGMRVVRTSEELKPAYEQASAEALAAFGDGSLYLEKLIENPRHVEVQILADSYGNLVHLGERECSLQRNHQKVLEEAPAASLTQEQADLIRSDALKAACACDYINAGTVEFIVDADGKHYFIEMNTRIQVEHPVTEMITSVNIVREQIRIASGLSLGFSQKDINISGHAIECRINAENPEQDFRPCPGKVEYLHLPSGYGVRVDTVLHPGYVVSPYYDSMIAKIIVHGRTRNEAICRMRRALEETVLSGIDTNLTLLYLLMYAPEYLANRIDTGFIQRNLQQLLKPLGNKVEL